MCIATTRRWQKGKDVYWYTRDVEQGGDAASELALVKQREADLMAEVRRVLQDCRWLPIVSLRASERLWGP